MKKSIFKFRTVLVFALTNLLFCSTLWAQAPQKMSYQAVIRNSDNALVTNTQVGIQVSILQDSETGSAIYVEHQTQPTNSNGLVGLVIGEGTTQSGDFSAIDWANGPFFIKTETDISGGTNYSIIGSSQLLSVPFALHTNETDPSVPVGTQAGEMQYWNGSAWVTITSGSEGEVLTFLSGVPTWSSGTPGAEIIDIDGNIYTSVTIGTQEWMVENLKTTKYNDGTDIPLVTENVTWGDLGSPAYCWYSNDISNKPTYGALYNWYTINTDNLCPTGWHAPTDDEWTTLTTYVGGESVAGTILKATSGWASNGNGSDYYGFSALPGGFRFNDGLFYDVSNNGNWWSSTQHNTTSAFNRSMDYSSESVNRYHDDKNWGFSVRCVKDN